MSKVLGFCGIESYDIVHLLSRTMAGLGKTVACVDYSDDGALACTVPFGLSTGDEAVYYDVTIRNAANTEEALTDEYSQYDYLIFYFGKTIKPVALAACEEVYLVTDYQKHNINFLKNVVLLDAQYRTVIYRNRVEAKIDLRYVMNELQPLDVDDDTFLYVEDSQQDYDNMVLLHVAILSIDFVSAEIVKSLKQLTRRK